MTAACDRQNPIKKGWFLEQLIATGRIEITKKFTRKDAEKMDELLPQLTWEELQKLRQHIATDLLANTTSEEKRRELLNDMGECPCCKRPALLGHNGPPADDADDGGPYRRQSSFKFDRSDE